MTSGIAAGLTTRYAEYINPFPEENTIASFMKFVPPKMREGLEMKFPVRVGLPHGIAHDDTNTAFDLPDAVAATHVTATITASTFVLVDNIPFNDVFATMHGISNGGGQGAAYWTKWDEATEGLMLAGDLYRELNLLYGPGPSSTAATSIGTVSASISGADLGTPQVVSITQASWIPGLWPKMTGALVDVYQSDLVTVRAAGVTVSNVSQSNNRLTLTKSGSAVTVAAGDVLLCSTAIDKSCYGLEAICANTGTIFGISASSYPQWKVATKAVGGAMSREIILEAAATLKNNGLTDGMTIFCSVPTVADLIAQTLDLQRFNKTEEIKTQGASSVEYITPAGLIKVQTHPYMKQGIAIGLPGGDVCKRVGSTDLTFDDGTGQMNVRPLSGKFGAQLLYSSVQAPIITTPWHAMYFTGIVNGADTAP